MNAIKGTDIAAIAITVAMATLIGRIVEPIVERLLDRVMPLSSGVRLP